MRKEIILDGVCIKKVYIKDALLGLLVKSYFCTYKGNKCASDPVLFPTKKFYASDFLRQTKQLIDKV